MEWLPIEVVETIAQHLTPRDLAACSTVSQSWRQIFNQDSLWRPYCDEPLAEYLRTARCKVKPGFVSPESEDSSLSPVCNWRLSYMRERHLWNNWRQWNCEKEEFLEIGPNKEHHPVYINSLSCFVNDDYFITSRDKKVLLWDLKGNPQHISDPFCMLFKHSLRKSFTTFGSNKLVLVQETAVQVLHFDSPIKATWTLELVFFFDGEETLSFTQAEQLIASHRYCTSCLGAFVVGSVFVGALTNGVMHFWDLNSGSKLKTVDMPFRGDAMAIAVVKADEKSNTFLVLMRSFNTLTFHVFSVTQLSFLPFTVSHELPFKRYPCCAIRHNHLAIGLENTFYVYDCNTSKLVLVLETKDQVIGAMGLDTYFLLISETNIEMFNTTTACICPFESDYFPVEKTEDEYRIIRDFDHISCGRFLTTYSLSTHEVFEIDLRLKSIKHIRVDMVSRYTSIGIPTKLVRTPFPYKKGVAALFNFW